MAVDYIFDVTFRGERRGHSIVEVTCTPKADAAVEWGKVVVTVRAADYQPMFAVYHDEEMQPARYMTYHEIRELGGRTVPTVMRVTPAANRQEYTQVTILESEYDIELPADTFTLRNLQR